MAASSPSAPRQSSVVIHGEQCKGCGRCILFCPKGTLELSQNLNRAGYRTAEVKNPAACTACGICFYSCPEPGGITVYKKTTETDED